MLPRCDDKAVLSPLTDSNLREEAGKILEQSQTVYELIESIIASPVMRGTLLWSELLKTELPERVWYKVRECFGERSGHTETFRSYVLISTESSKFSVLTDSDHAVVRTAVFDNRDDFYVGGLMKIVGYLSGEFRITQSEPDREIEFSGDYDIYVYQGLVAFVRNA